MPLPTFIIGGERRCGTTSLAKWIECHPDVYLLPKIDMAYFVDEELIGSRNWITGEVDEKKWDKTHGVEEYAKFFDEGYGKQAIGEKSADYLFWRPAHSRISCFLPHTKFIFTLRNPTERAWSHYWNEVGKGREVLSFEEAVVEEAKRCRDSAYARDHLSYCTRGFYEESLGDFFRYVERERVMVVTVEDMKARPVEFLQDIYRHIGVNPYKGLDCAGKQFNTNWVTIPREWTKLPFLRNLEKSFVWVLRKTANRFGRNGVDKRDIQRRLLSGIRKTKDDMMMAESTRRQLNDLFTPHIEKLEKMLGRTFDEWKS